MDCVNATDFVNYDASLIGVLVVSIICFFDMNVEMLFIDWFIGKSLKRRIFQYFASLI
jgi:hypothetical protein